MSNRRSGPEQKPLPRHLALRFLIESIDPADRNPATHGAHPRKPRPSKIEGSWDEVVDQIWNWEHQVHQIFPRVSTTITFEEPESEPPRDD